MDTQELVIAIDTHLRLLRHAGTQALAIEWMKQAHTLLTMCATELERPKVFAVPGHFGAPTFTLTPPTGLVLPAPGFKKPPPIWLQGETVVYGSKPASKAWTHKDTLRLERESARKRAKVK